MCCATRTYLPKLIIERSFYMKMKILFPALFFVTSFLNADVIRMLPGGETPVYLSTGTENHPVEGHCEVCRPSIEGMIQYTLKDDCEAYQLLDPNIPVEILEKYDAEESIESALRENEMIELSRVVEPILKRLRVPFIIIKNNVDPLYAERVFQRLAKICAYHKALFIKFSMLCEQKLREAFAYEIEKGYCEVHGRSVTIKKQFDASWYRDVRDIIDEIAALPEFAQSKAIEKVAQEINFWLYAISEVLEVELKDNLTKSQMNQLKNPDVLLSLLAHIKIANPKMYS